MALTAPCPLIYLILYALLNKEPLNRPSRKEILFKLVNAGKKESGEKKEEIYESLQQGDEKVNVNREENINTISLEERTVEKIENTNLKIEQTAENEKNAKDESAASKENSQTENKSEEPDELTIKFKTAATISPFIFCLFVTYFSEYLANHAVITTLAFPSNTISPRDHYPYYMLTYHIGKFLGRSHVFLITCFSPGLLKYVLVKKTWILALISFAHLLIFLSMSWFRYVDHISYVLILCVTEGFIAGSMYVNSVHAVTETIDDLRQKEFALGLLTVGDATGKLFAGIVGLWHEPMLKKHCLEKLDLGMYCFTRHATRKGWTNGKY